MSKKEDSKIIASLLFDKYEKVTLTATEAAEAIGISKDLLRKDREEAIGIPCTRINGKEKGTPLYSITAIANTIVANEQKTITKGE